MLLSGFSMVRNAEKYYFPIKEAIESVLPIVDEFIVALGKGDTNDKTRELIESIDSDKVRILDRVWDEKDFVGGYVFAKETSFALSQCKGKWCFYLQADEVVHEKNLEAIKDACNKYKDQKKVEGFLFDYYHFFGDYDHHLPYHGWYKKEIRIVRNNIGIRSYKDAQSFRKKDNKKLRVKKIDAHIYHYGWVRPPQIMLSKRKEQHSMHHGKKHSEKIYDNYPTDFDYGALGTIPLFKGTHPKVMHGFIEDHHWKSKLNYTKKAKLMRPPMKHEQLKYRLLSYIENNLLFGKEIGGYSNWELLK